MRWAGLQMLFTYDVDFIMERPRVVHIISAIRIGYAWKWKSAEIKRRLYLYLYTRRVAEAATLVAAPKPNLNRQSLCNYTAIFAEERRMGILA